MQTEKYRTREIKEEMKSYRRRSKRRESFSKYFTESS